MNQWNNEILLNQNGKEPKAIFEAYCSELGEHYAKHGFKYFKSRPRIERQTQDLVETINFWSSRNNAMNEYVHLEILPYVKSKSLKKWIKSNSIGRNEYLFAIKRDYPRNVGIYGHRPEDLDELIHQIDIKVICRLEEFREAILDVNVILETDQFDEGLITDNFLAHLCMQYPELIDKALDKYGRQISEETRMHISEFRNAN